MGEKLYYVVKTIGIILTAAALFVCIFSGYLFYCNKSGMDVPALGPFQMYVVLSDSMYPVMRTDDAIVVRQKEAADLKEGDIITFYAFESDIIITHRIVGVNQNGNQYEFNTKGDNNNTPDKFVTPEGRVIGKYEFKIPQFGGLLTKASEKPLFIAIPVIVLVIIQVLLGQAEEMLNPKKRKEDKVNEKGEESDGSEND